MSDGRDGGTEGTKGTEDGRARHFIQEIIDEDNRTGKHAGRVATRFPPEPNGYLHIGHAKSIVLNSGLAAEYGGTFNLRFDDTNPTTEEVEYVESIKHDIRWLGADWQDRCFFASDYFGQMYEWAEQLIRQGQAYVCQLNEEETSAQRGNFYKPGSDSPWRGRTVEENLDLFRRMRAGEFPDGACTLRAKIDMAHPNMNMRDPVMYRIRHTRHHRTGDAWCIYPSYDWAHGLEDSIERITHSICTLEFEDHRPLYDWFLIQLGVFRPRQIEFARLNLTWTVMSKRRLLQLVKEGHVTGWDDPRMPTLAGLRRRGVPPQAIRAFCERVGVAKADSTVDMELLDFAIRDELNRTAPRAMAVVRPLRVTIENWPEGSVEWIEAQNHPDDPSAGSRKVPFSRELYIERDDFAETPPKGFFRLSPGREVRLRYAYYLTCTGVEKDADGVVTGLRCTYDPATRGGDAPDGRKVKATIHWVSAAHAAPAELRLYDRLFGVADPMDVPEGTDWKSTLNPASLEVVAGARVEPFLAAAGPGDRFQFERQGYFCADEKDSKPGAPVFNRTIGLRDTWAKVQKTAGPAASEPPRPVTETKPKNPEPFKPEISIDDFGKVDLRVGLIREASLVEGADKLLRLSVDLGEERPRQIFAGIRQGYPEPSVLVGRRVIVVANLVPRKMKFGLSEGMVLAGAGGEGYIVAGFEGEVEAGSEVR